MGQCGGKKLLNVIAIILVIVGALNWGLVGFFNWNLVESIFGDGFGRVIYAIVGLAGLWSLSLISKCCHSCCCNHDHKKDDNKPQQ